MEPNPQFQCPRPRNTRACTHCRAKRTRCLRELAHSPCRRCQVLHLPCHMDNASASPKVARPVANTKETDVVSGLFGASPNQPASDNLLSVHQRIFQERFSKYEASPPSSLPISSKGSGMRPPVLDQKRADELVERFRAKSNYFPFVTAPADIASPEHRFLYLAVLTVAATDDMTSLRSLDDRFRSVLAERIVVGGEKSLDYLQGLLVYIAWYNMQIRPMNLQVYQYLQIAISMVTDLRYDDDSVPIPDTPSSIEAKNACLGCFYLSSLVSTNTKRPNNATLSEGLKAYLDDLSQSDSSQAQMMSRCLLLQMNIEAIYRNEVPLYEILPNDLDTPAIQLEYLFLAFFRETFPGPDSSSPAWLHSVNARANEFLHYIISLPVNEIHNFSTIEWTRFILVMQSILEFLSGAARQPELIQTTRECARQVSIHLEPIANRLAQLSKSGRNPGEYPDMLYLLKSVLNLLLPLEVKIGLPAQDGQDSNQNQNGKAQFKEGKCPVLVGIRETDFWAAYQNSPALPSYDLGVDFGGLFGDEPSLELSQEEWMHAARSLDM